ncbi:MAG: carbohydrate ABC transporter substrate-binding protein, partial [Eubacteriales bacterium]|nr:carbohydrate ABC transporter substrate-binding protein [Eubacteriales bacterium]
MRKFTATLLTLVLALGLIALPSAAEDVTISLFHNKVEIAEALQNFAKLYSDKTDGVTVTIESLGGGADYAGNLTAKLTADAMPDIFVIEGDGDYKLWKEYMTDLSEEKWNE